MAQDIPDQIIIEVDPEIEEEESLVLKRQGTANHSKSLNNESISHQNALIQEDVKSDVNPTSEEELKRELQKWISQKYMMKLLSGVKIFLEETI